MPLEKEQKGGKKEAFGPAKNPSFLERYRGYIETAAWLLIVAIAYIAMQKVMHPGWTFFGI